ncbi:Fumarylacetoacetate hydrolase domain-containing protein 2 [Talaromyces islandicus]|uniref:Fumarylacetoacetate hydrolase domain-containing protein 2 n=1 Tax=Talaromyces islandicus TaxID=28573 RepID=A0A0U1LU44_TALIS|nr:Fumarylacetoacetate hydrolase domain-containing protein 2 [Talaromyces islandicus]
MFRRNLATMASSFSRLVRFVPKSDASKVLVGEPVDPKIDVGLALYEGKDVQVNRFTGSSILSPGENTGTVESIKTILSPLAQSEYTSHAAEMGLAIPELPTVFLKPATSLADPWPAPSILPKITQKDNTGDYESELAIIIGKTAKDVSEADALDYVLGYTAANDVSSRTSQTNQSQWCFSKGFDSACPLGPVVASSSLVPDAAKFQITGTRNGTVVQDCPLTDMIFNVSQLVSFLSQGTTLPPGTVILTGTPPGVGAAKKPPQFLKAGEEFRVTLAPHVGTLITRFENEQ